MPKRPLVMTMLQDIHYRNSIVINSFNLSLVKTFNTLYPEMYTTQIWELHVNKYNNK